MVRKCLSERKLKQVHRSMFRFINLNALSNNISSEKRREEMVDAETGEVVYVLPVTYFSVEWSWMRDWMRHLRAMHRCVMHYSCGPLPLPDRQNYTFTRR